jgi:adenylate cyclase
MTEDGKGEVVPAKQGLSSEIERKFFVAKLPEDLQQQYHSYEIKQGYLLMTPNGAELRLRQAGEKYSLGVKSGGDLERREGELNIDAELFRELWPATDGRRLEKVRYLIPLGEATVELDIYGGKLEGLVLAEVEFSSVEQSAAFVPPDWFGREVTADRRYKARELVARGLSR